MMRAPSDSDDDEEHDWQIGDEVVFGLDARRGFISAVSAHGHLKHQLVRVSEGDGWGRDMELSATDPLLKRATFYMPTPTTLAVDRAYKRRLLQEEEDEAMGDKEEAKERDLADATKPNKKPRVAAEAEEKKQPRKTKRKEENEEEEDQELVGILS